MATWANLPICSHGPSGAPQEAVFCSVPTCRWLNLVLGSRWELSPPPHPRFIYSPFTAAYSPLTVLGPEELVTRKHPSRLMGSAEYSPWLIPHQPCLLPLVSPFSPGVVVRESPPKPFSVGGLLSVGIVQAHWFHLDAGIQGGLSKKRKGGWQEWRVT